MDNESSYIEVTVITDSSNTVVGKRNALILTSQISSITEELQNSSGDCNWKSRIVLKELDSETPWIFTSDETNRILWVEEEYAVLTTMLNSVLPGQILSNSKLEDIKEGEIKQFFTGIMESLKTATRLVLKKPGNV